MTRIRILLLFGWKNIQNGRTKPIPRVSKLWCELKIFKPVNLPKYNFKILLVGKFGGYLFAQTFLFISTTEWTDHFLCDTMCVEVYQFLTRRHEFSFERGKKKVELVNSNAATEN